MFGICMLSQSAVNKQAGQVKRQDCSVCPKSARQRKHVQLGLHPLIRRISKAVDRFEKSTDFAGLCGCLCPAMLSALRISWRSLDSLWLSLFEFNITLRYSLLPRILSRLLRWSTNNGYLVVSYDNSFNLAVGDWNSVTSLSNSRPNKPPSGSDPSPSKIYEDIQSRKQMTIKKSINVFADWWSFLGVFRLLRPDPMLHKFPRKNWLAWTWARVRRSWRFPLVDLSPVPSSILCWLLVWSFSGNRLLLLEGWIMIEERYHDSSKSFVEMVGYRY